MLGNTPMQQTVFRLERAKSFAFTMKFWLKDGTEYDTTTSTVRMVVKEPTRLGGTIVITEVAVQMLPEINTVQFQLQAADLDLEAGEYAFDITLDAQNGYSTPIMKGVIDLGDNTDPFSTLNTYSFTNPTQWIDVAIHNGATIDVNVNQLPWVSTGGTTLEVFDDGVSIEAPVSQINFAGAGVVVTNPSTGRVTVTIPGGGGGGSFATDIATDDTGWTQYSGANAQLAFDAIDVALAAHFNGSADRHAATAIDVSSTGAYYNAGPLSGVLGELDTSLGFAFAGITTHGTGGANRHNGAAIDITATGAYYNAGPLSGVLSELDTSIGFAVAGTTNHLNDTTDAHDASAISVDPTGYTAYTGTDAQAAFSAIDVALAARISAHSTLNSAYSNHVFGIADQHAASAITYDDTGFVEYSGGVTVQGALANIDVALQGKANTADLASTLDAYWRFDNGVTQADPGVGKFRLNNADPDLATNLYINKTTDGGTDMSNFASLLDTGDTVFLQVRSDASITVRYTLAAAPTVIADYWVVPVTLDQAKTGGAISQNTEVLFLWTIAALGGGGGGGGGATVLDDLTDVDLSTTPPINGQVLKYNGTLWVPGTDNTGGGGGDHVIGNSYWNYSATTTMGDPTGAFFRLDSTTLNAVTAAAFNYADGSSTDSTEMLRRVAVGDEIVIARRSSPRTSDEWARYRVTSVTDNTTWFQFGLSYIDHGGGALGSLVEYSVQFVHSNGAGGGGGGGFAIVSGTGNPTIAAGTVGDYYDRTDMSANLRFGPKVATVGPLTVTNRSSTNKERTLTIGTHSLTVGTLAEITGVAANYNGVFPIMAVTATTITVLTSTIYSEASTASSGSVSAAWPATPQQISKLPPKMWADTLAGDLNVVPFGRWIISNLNTAGEPLTVNTGGGAVLTTAGGFGSSVAAGGRVTLTIKDQAPVSGAGTMQSVISVSTIPTEANGEIGAFLGTEGGAGMTLRCKQGGVIQLYDNVYDITRTFTNTLTAGDKLGLLKLGPRLLMAIHQPASGFAEVRVVNDGNGLTFMQYPGMLIKESSTARGTFLDLQRG